MKIPRQPDALLAIAQSYGTPTYVYEEAVLRERCQQLTGHFRDLPVKMLYAMKANFQPALLQFIKEEGIGLDTVSPAELALALKLGFKPEDILFSANYSEDWELDFAVSKGVAINIGEPGKLQSFGKKYPGSKVWLRINPHNGAGHHEYVITAGDKTKFGIPMFALEDVAETCEQYGLQVVGLHQHIGSGVIDAKMMQESVEMLLNVVPHFPDIQALNFGGGLGIPYHEKDHPYNFEESEKSFLPILRNWLAKQDKNYTLYFEPGRFPVAESGTLLVNVTGVKHGERRVFAGTNSGQNHLIRPMLYGAHHEIFNLSNPDGILHRYDITGNICESGDRFASERKVQHIRENDVLAIMDAGAYGMAMASLYNLRALPAEVLLKSDGTTQVIRPRKSPDDLADELLSNCGVSI